MTDPVNTVDIGQTEYMQLFMQELAYQDPLKPVDNKEFLAQMAQFTTLQETKNTNELLAKLLGMTSANQSLNLLGKKVQIQDGSGKGTVEYVQFFALAPPKLAVHMENGGMPMVELTQITEVEA